MTIEISTLRVVSEMDSSSYEAGARQKVAADDAMVASAQKAGQAFTQLDQKVSNSVNYTERLKRTYIDGYASAQRFNQAIDNLSRSLERDNKLLEQVPNLLDGIYRKHGMVADASKLAARGQLDLAKAVEQANGRFREQEKVTPTRSGASANQNVGNNHFAAMNATYQLQDTIVTAAGGLNPLTIGLQQGSQLAGAFSGMGVKQAGSTLLGAISNLLSPLTLVTVGLTAAGAAAIQFGSKALAPVRTLDDAVKAHADNVDLLRKRYGDLSEQVKISGSLIGSGFLDANLRSNDLVMRAVARQEEKKYISTLQTDAGFKGYLPLSNTNVQASQLTNLTGGLADFQKPIGEFLTEIRNGTPDLEKFQKQIDQTFNGLLGSSETTDNLMRSADAAKALGESFLTSAGSVKVLGDNGKETTQSLAPFSAAIARLKLGLADNNGNAFGQFIDDVSRVGQANGLEKVADQVLVLGKNVADLNQQLKEFEAKKAALFNAIGPGGFALSQGTINTGPLAPGTMGDMALYESRQKIAMSRTQQALNAQLNGLYARNPDEKAAAARAQASAVYNNDESPAQRRQRIDNAELMARRQAEKELNDAQRDRQMTLAKTLDDQRNEISLIGKTAGEAAALRKEYELISALKMDAARNNRKVDEDEISLIREKAKELGALTDAYNKAKFQDDLSFQQRQMGRNAGDQQIASQLRGAGLPENLGSGEANQLRSMAQQQAARTQLNGFYSDFVSTLRSNGGNAGEAFGEAFKNAVLNSAAKMGEQAMDRIFGWLISGLQSQGGSQAGGVGGLFSKGLGLTGGIAVQSMGGVANDNRSAVTRLALPEIGKSQTGIPLSQISTAGGLSTSVASAYAPQFQGFVKDLEASGYGIKSIGGYNYRNIAGTNKLSEHAFGKAIDINPSANPMGKSLITDMPSNVGDMASKWGLSWGGAWGSKKDAMHFEVANDSASKALERLASSTGTVDKGFSSLTSGLTQVGSSLGGKAGGIANVAGGFDWSSLTGPGFKANTTYGDFIGATKSQQSSGGSGIFGLLGGLAKGIGSLFHFADGTESAPGGMAIVGERGRELVNLPRGSQVVPNHRTESLMAANKNGGGNSGTAGKTDINVMIMGNAYGNDHLQNSINAGVQQGLKTAAINNERGGTGDSFRRYQANKG